MVIEMIALILLILIAIPVLYALLKIGSILIKIIFHLFTGWILLILVNFIPGISIPITLLTIIVSGFGGIFGTILLVILYLI